jgi:hypothetical protein
MVFLVRLLRQRAVGLTALEGIGTIRRHRALYATSVADASTVLEQAFERRVAQEESRR